MELGLVSRGGTADEELLKHAREWCSMSVAAMIQEFEQINLENSSNKWTCIETLI
jgi:hypothetical protein